MPVGISRSQAWEERKVRKMTTKPPTHQHVVSGGTANGSEELKTENVTQSARSSDPPRSDHLSEASLSQLEQGPKVSQAHPSMTQPQYQYTLDEEGEGEEDDEDPQSEISGPSKYAPSGYAPSSHHGVTHDLLSHYEPSVYEADSQYDPSVFGRESEYGDESSYSYSQDARSSHRGGYGSRGRPTHMSGRGSVADSAAGSALHSVMESDDREDVRHGYEPSESYVSSYVSSEDEARPPRTVHPRVAAEMNQERSPPSAFSSRHNAHRSGRESLNGGRGGFSSNGGGRSSRHSGGRSGFENGSRDFDEETQSYGGPVPMEGVRYYEDDEQSQVPSGQGVPLTHADEHGSRSGW